SLREDDYQDLSSHRGGQKAVSSGGKFGFPQNVRVTTDGSIVVADRDALGGAGAIIRLDANTGAQTVVSSGENLFNPTDLALDTEGKLLIAAFNSFVCGPGGYTGAGAGAIRHEGTGLAESGKRCGNWISQATRGPSQASG